MKLGIGVRRAAFRYDVFETGNDAVITSLRRSKTDLLIVQPGNFPPGFTGDVYVNASDLAKLRANSGPAMIGTYLSPTRLETNRDFYSGIANFVITDRYLNYTQASVVSTIKTEISRLVKTIGFDALFLDDLASYYILSKDTNTFGAQGTNLKEAARSMMKYVIDLSTHAKSEGGPNKDVKIIGNIDPYHISHLIYGEGTSILSSVSGGKTDAQLSADYVAALDGITFESQYGGPSERAVVDVLNISFRSGGPTSHPTIMTINYNLNSDLTSDDAAKGLFFWRALKDRIIPYASRGPIGTDALVNPETTIVDTGTSNSDIMSTGEAGGLRSGLGGNDTLVGGYGRDQFNGGIGNDYLDGDGGQDTAIFSVARDALIVRRQHRGAWTVTSSEGTDTLIEIERISTTTGTIALNRAEMTDLRVGDLNGDGRSDIVWRADAGQLGYWFPTPNAPVMDYAQSEVVGHQWRLIGDSDFNGDGKSDLLWRHNDGTVAIWLMDGGVRTNASVYAGVASTQWGIETIDDFNGDGRADIVWREDSGRLAIWGMDGTTTIATSVLSGVPDSWEIVGSGRLKGGDQKADILWFNAQTREMALWDSVNPTGFGFNQQIVRQLDFMWKPIAIADFNGDGFDDVLVWKDSDKFVPTDSASRAPHNLAVFASGAGGLSSAPSYSVYWNPDLVLTAVGDFNGDGRADMMFSSLQAGAHRSGIKSDGSHIIVYSSAVGVDPNFPTGFSFATPTTWAVM